MLFSLALGLLKKASMNHDQTVQEADQLILHIFGLFFLQRFGDEPLGELLLKSSNVGKHPC